MNPCLKGVQRRSVLVWTVSAEEVGESPHLSLPGPTSGSAHGTDLLPFVYTSLLVSARLKRPTSGSAHGTDLLPFVYTSLLVSAGLKRPTSGSAHGTDLLPFVYTSLLVSARLKRPTSGSAHGTDLLPFVYTSLLVGVLACLGVAPFCNGVHGPRELFSNVNGLVGCQQDLVGTKPGFLLPVTLSEFFTSMKSPGQKLWYWCVAGGSKETTYLILRGGVPGFLIITN
ncbi:hypothetical protein WMY93_021947 [Mugilogobius chulae]|uniref:Uncharacterized protein n=1 Tax=Mugilogobius chulae TaxID=88201 RepID=A0AAW0NH24_9GOBI